MLQPAQPRRKVGRIRGEEGSDERAQVQAADDGDFQREEQRAGGRAEQGGKARRHARDEQNFIRVFDGDAAADVAADRGADLDSRALPAHARAEQVRRPRARVLEEGAAQGEALFFAAADLKDAAHIRNGIAPAAEHKGGKNADGGQKPDIERKMLHAEGAEKIDPPAEDAARRADAQPHRRAEQGVNKRLKPERDLLSDDLVHISFPFPNNVSYCIRFAVKKQVIPREGAVSSAQKYPRMDCIMRGCVV